MNETPKRSWWREPLLWFAIVFVPLWIMLIVGWVNGEALIDRVPVLSLGILDTIMVFAVITTCFWLVLALLLRMSGRTRMMGLAGLFVTIGAAIFVLPQFFEFDMDGDVRPLGFRLKQASGSLPIEVEGEIAPLQVSSSSFTQFLGPNRDLTVPWLDIGQEARAVDCPVVWRRPVGAGWSGFTAVDGLAFTMEQHGNREVVVAYRVADGKRVWIHEAIRRHFHPAGGTGPRSTPTFHDNRLYTLGAIGNLVCLKANTGEVLWERDLLAEFNIPVVVSNPNSDSRTDVEQSNVLWGRAASPLIVGDLVVVPVGGPTDGPQVTLAAFDRVSGELRWKGGKRAISYGSPTVVTLHGQPQIVLTTEDHVCGFDPTNGEELWNHSRPGRSNGDANTSQPIAVSDDQLLVTKEYGMGGELLQLNRNADGKWSVESLWRNPRVLKTKFTIAAVRNEYAYAISSGILECVNWKTGEQVWRGERVRHGQMLVTRQHLVVMSEDGNLTVAAVDPEDYMPQFTVEGLLSGRCWNTLCIYEDKLLARSDREAICVRLPRARPRIDTASAQPHPVQRLVNWNPPGDGLQQDQDTKPIKTLQEWSSEYEAANAQNNRDAALTALDGILANYPNEAFTYYQRGCLRCWTGNFPGSVADFDKYVELRPEVERRLWERGISQYFAGQYEAGAKQFELYQSYHDNDVENSVWRYLCQAKTEGHAAARENLLPIKNDPRIPLMDIYRLFKGEANVDDVLNAITAGKPSAAESSSRRFYVHYYLGLYYDSLGQTDKSLEHLQKALEVPAESPFLSRYMWDVAKVHAETIKQQAKAPEPK